MDSKRTLSKIMELLNLQDEIKLESMKLENGTIIEAEAFEPNQEVFIVTEDDEKIALPVGEYELEDGRYLVVAEEGIIAEVREESAEEEEAPAPEAEEEMAEEPVALTEERVREIVAEMLKEVLGKEEEMAEEPQEEVKEEVEMAAEEPVEVEEVKEDVNLEAELPAAKPIKHSPDSKPVDNKLQFSKSGRKDTLSRIFDKLGK